MKPAKPLVIHVAKCGPANSGLYYAVDLPDDYSCKFWEYDHNITVVVVGSEGSKACEI